MAIVLNTLDDFIDALETDRDARKRLKFVLFDMDIEESLRELRRSHDEMFRYIRESERRTDARLSNLEDDVAVLKDDVAVLKDDVAVLKEDVRDLKRDMRDVKGMGYEGKIQRNAAGIFGRIVRRGHDGKNDVIDHLYETGDITEQEIEQVVAADLIWSGKRRNGGQKVVLIVEASWLAETNDVTRAYERANILKKAGLNAVSVVAGKEWTATASDLAEKLDVLIVANSGIAPQSWAAFNNNASR